jgi:hypothetical protein
MHTSGGHAAFIGVIAIGAFMGAPASLAIYYRDIGAPRALLWESWDFYMMLEGALAGALLANLAWVLRHPRVRLRRSAMIAVAANIVVWTVFLAATPSLTASEFDAIQAERNRRDADSGMDFITHEPVIVAGRMFSTYGAFGVSERLLQIFAMPAIEWIALLTVPWEYGPARATRAESYIVAAGGVVLSTAFWAAFAPAVGSLVRAWRRHRRQHQRSGSHNEIGGLP